MVMINYVFLQTLYTKVTIKHPSGRSLVYSYRLLLQSLLIGLITRTALLLYRRRGRGHRRLASRDRRRRPPISHNGRPRQLSSRPIRSRLIEWGRRPTEVYVANHCRRQVKQADTKFIRLLRTDLLGIPPLQPGQVDQRVVGTYHAEDVRSGELPSVLDEPLKPAPRLLRLLDWGHPRCAGLVFGELRADQVKHRGHSFPDLDTIGLPGVPVLDQLVEVLLGVNLKHYDKIIKENQARSQYKHERNRVA